MKDSNATSSPSALVCSAATSNKFLQAWIESNGNSLECARCGTTHRCVGSRPFAEYVDGVIRSHTTPVVHYDPDDAGEGPLEVIKRVAGVDDRLAQQVIAAGRTKAADDICYYDYNLSFIITGSSKTRKDWERVREIVRHEARFFGTETRSLLDRLLGDVETICDGIAIRTLTPADVIYRGRLERAPGQAKIFFEAPTLELCSPPSGKATAGRMNSVGIRAFYGALNEELCVAELRPPLTSRLVTGRFRPTRDLRIVDLGLLGPAFSGAYEFADLFDPAFDSLSEKLEFLRLLEGEIARHVRAGEEDLQYLTTQIVAEYLVHVKGLDGIAYRSAQGGDASQWRGIVNPRNHPNQRNVALFGSAGRVVEEADPGPNPGLTFEANSAHMLYVSKIAINTEDDMWAHYVDPPGEEDES